MVDQYRSERRIKMKKNERKQAPKKVKLDLEILELEAKIAPKVGQNGFKLEGAEC
jgi:hypothetical protein